MGQPEFVPLDAEDQVRVAELLPVPGPWVPDRPGDVKASGGNPSGPWLGSTGPDQGYALRLAATLRDQLTLAPREAIDDVVAGCVEAAMKRSALFGRAPIRTDVEVAFTLWGFLGGPPDPALVEFRRPRFAQVSHHYADRRALVDLVSDDTLRLPLDEVRSRARADWRSLLDVG
jgi:hypothetical protein